MSENFADVVGTAVKGGYSNSLQPEKYINMSPVVGQKSWASSDGAFSPIGESYPRLPSGLYSCEVDGQGRPYLRKMANNIDSLIDLPDSESERLLSEVMKFRELKNAFTNSGFLYKRGILLWGPPGSGKTVTIQQLLKMFVTDGDGIAVMLGHPELSSACLHLIRGIEPDRQILAIAEDIDALIDRFGETGYLNLLDGESQIQNVVYVATTNYPERLDKRFADRPSRFDTIRKIGMPTSAARKAYLVAKMPDADDVTIARFVSGTDGFSIAYLRELIVLTQCFGFGFDESLQRLNEMHKKQPKSSDAEGSTFGFA